MVINLSSSEYTYSPFLSRVRRSWIFALIFGSTEYSSYSESPLKTAFVTRPCLNTLHSVLSTSWKIRHFCQFRLLVSSFSESAPCVESRPNENPHDTHAAAAGVVSRLARPRGTCCADVRRQAKACCAQDHVSALQA